MGNLDLSNLRKNLQEVVDKKNAEKKKEDETRQQRNEEDRRTMLESMSKDFGEVFKPYLDKIQEHSQLSSDQLSRIIAESVKVDVPGLDTSGIEAAIEASIAKAMGAISIPTPQSHVNIPDIHIPPINMPDTMNIEGWIGIMGYDKGLLRNPLPVQIRDSNGKPVDFSHMGGQTVLGGGGGKADFLTIKGFSSSAFSDLQDPDGRLKVVLPSGATGLTDTELRASSVPVAQASGAIFSTYVTGAAASTYAEIMNPDGRVKVELPTGSSGLTDTELRASALQVLQVSGSVDSVIVNAILTSLEVKQVSGNIDSVYVTGMAASSFAEIMNPDGRVKVELPTGSSGLTNTELRAAAVEMIQVSGSIFSTYLQNPAGDGEKATALRVLLAGDSVASVIINDSLITFKIDQVSGAIFSVNNVGPVGQGDAASALRVILAGNSDASVIVNNPQNQGDVATALRVVLAGNSDASVVIQSQPIAFETRQVSGFADSVFVTGFVDSSVVVEAMTTNRTAKADGADIRPKADKQGRQVMRPITVRDLTRTAYLSLANGTETTLRAGVAGAFLDLIMIVGSNNSDAAVSVDIRAVTAGNIIHTLRIPANSTAGWSPNVPWPQDATGNNWTVDGPDETGRTLTFSALFSEEV